MSTTLFHKFFFLNELSNEKLNFSLKDFIVKHKLAVYIGRTTSEIQDLFEAKFITEYSAFSKQLIICTAYGPDAVSDAFNMFHYFCFDFVFTVYSGI